MIPVKIRNVFHISVIEVRPLFFRVYYFTAVRIFPFFGAGEDSSANAKYKVMNEICRIIQGKG